MQERFLTRDLQIQHAHNKLWAYKLSFLKKSVLIPELGIIDINIRGSCVLGGENSGIIIECHLKPFS